METGTTGTALTPEVITQVLAHIEQTKQLPQDAFAALGVSSDTAYAWVMRGSAEEEDPESLFGKLYRSLAEQQARLHIR